MDYNYYILFWVCIFGLCLGSFYNVVIIRSLKDESIVFPPSKCPKCGNKLFWWHNIPIVSYILLRGKCYFCKEKISIQYPVIEFITMLIFAGVYCKFGLTVKALFVVLWMSLLLIMTMTDLKEKIVDCNIAIATAISGIIYNFITAGLDGLILSILGLLSGVIILELIARTGYLFVKNRAMGEADSYVAGALGAIFGYKLILPVLLCSFIVSMIFIVPMFLYQRYRAYDKKTCVLSILFTVAVLLFKTVSENMITLVLMATLGLLLCISVIKGMKQEQNLNYLPFVPALSIGAVLGIILIF